MRKGLLLWFFTLLCVHVLNGLSLDEVHTMENKDGDVSKHPLVAQEKQVTYGSSNANLHRKGDHEAKNHTFVTRKSQNGKGSYGGASVVHHPSPIEKAAASVLESPSVFISTTNMYAGTYSSGAVNARTKGDGENLEAKHHFFVTKKAQRGKGSTGGANVAHHPRPTDKAAASVLESPSIFLSTTNVCIGVSLLLLFPLHIH